jgi:transketolase
MDEDESVVLLLGDIGVYAFRDTFARHPKRCYNLGVCEQASVGLAAGLAMSGLYPIYHTISAFLVRRAYEFIRLDFGEQKLAGLFVGVGGANEYEKLGPTHRCEEQAALMTKVPMMHSYFPADEKVAGGWISQAVIQRQLAYISLEEPRA